MNDHVMLYIERFPAKFTGKGLFSRMDPQVIFEGMRLFELFGAETAGIRPLIGMNPQMLLQIPFPGKPLIAILARKGIVRVDNLVDLQIGFVLKLFAAVSALILLLSSSRRRR